MKEHTKVKLNLLSTGSKGYPWPLQQTSWLAASETALIVQVSIPLTKYTIWYVQERLKHMLSYVCFTHQLDTLFGKDTEKAWG